MLPFSRKAPIRRILSFRGFAASGDETAVKDINEQIVKLKQAQAEFATYTQEQVDHIFQHVAHEAAKQRVPLAQFAVKETRLGAFEDKVIKNSVACELPLSRYLNSKTVGIIDRDPTEGLTKIAIPKGPVAAILPTTNPTSTAILKSLFGLKTRNAMIFLPHPRAAKCTAEAVRVCHDAAVAAGAPVNVLQCVIPSREATNIVIHHPDIKLILATGGPGMVKSSYESGHPAIGVGAGNAAIVIDETADLKAAASSIVLGKTFDNGTICASEQSVVLVEEIYEKAKATFEARGVHFVTGADRKKLGDFLIVDGHINSDIVGQSARTIAERIGITIPKGTVVLAAEATEVGPGEPFSFEKLSPVLGFFRAKDFKDACAVAKSIVDFGGRGHTSAIYTEKRDRLEYFSLLMPAFHLMCNMPTSLGAIGSSYNFNVAPSLTLGVGSIAGSSLSGNLTPFDLLDIKTVAEKQPHMEFYKNPPAVYMNRNCTEEALDDLTRDKALKKALIITDKAMNQLGYVARVEKALTERGIEARVFDDVTPDPNMTVVRAGVKVCEAFRPDVIIGLGGGSPLDAAKFIRVQYENPAEKVEDLSARFVELRKRTHKFPDAGKIVKKFVAIPTTSGTGSEVSPFAVITDDLGHKHPIFSYRMTPDIAIIDSSYTENLPKSLIAFGGLDAITHAMESYVSCAANDFTMSHSLTALKLLFDNLSVSYHKGGNEVREKVHHASSIAGLAFSNAYLGICHSLSHKVAAKFHLPHGLTNAILLPHVMIYNFDPKPTREAYYPNYTHPQSHGRYAFIADSLGLKHDAPADATPLEVQRAKLVALVNAFVSLTKELHTPTTFAEAGVDRQAFLDNLEQIAVDSFDDQCTDSNPRFPLVEELKPLLLRAYDGKYFE